MSDGLRVIVCGGRNYRDFTKLVAFMEAFNSKRPIRHLFHGNASGADKLSASWANGYHGSWISIHACPANWKRDGKAAGPIRNKNMLGQRPDVVIAFPGGKGTAHMVKIARQAGVEVIEVSP